MERHHRCLESYVFTECVAFLEQKKAISLQLLSRYFYYTQMPRCLSSAQIILPKSRIHYYNQNYMIIFNLITMEKAKKAIKEFNPLWNCQTIEVRGKIYLTGGSKANTKDYLKSTFVLNETVDPWEFFPLEHMNFARDAHGTIGWKSRHIIVVGSWHSLNEEECSKKKCEIYSI